MARSLGLMLAGFLIGCAALQGLRDRRLSPRAGAWALGAMLCALPAPRPPALGALVLVPRAEVATPARALLTRDRDGHFRAAALVNGQPVELLVDTGATLVMLTPEDARRAGFDPARLAMTRPVQTANGPARVATVLLAELRVGGVVLTDVPAAVAGPGLLHGSLLGMSFLGRLEALSVRGPRMVFSASQRDG